MQGTELEKIQNEADEIVTSAIQSNSQQSALNELFFRLGGLDVIQTLANNLNAALIVNLQRIRDEEQYRVAGFNRFDDFMDNHPRSPMAYKKFNYIEGIFKTVGPDVFDVLSGSGLSLRQQKLLERGDVEIDGDEIIINHDGEIISFEITNRREWLDSIKVLAKANAEKSAKLDRQKEKIDRHDTEKREIYAELDKVRAARSAEVSGDPHSMAFASLGFAFTALREQAALLSDVDRAARRDNVLEILANQMQLTREAYGSGPVRANAVTGPAAGQSFDEFLAAGLDAIDLDAVDVDDNDAELAAAL